MALFKTHLPITPRFPELSFPYTPSAPKPLNPRSESLYPTSPPITTAVPHRSGHSLRRP